MTNKDRMAINELLQVTHAFKLDGSSERKGEENHMQFLLTAPGRTRSWFTSSGFSIEEAIDKWYDRVLEVEGIQININKKEELSSLYAAKAEVIEIEAQFYG
jgi:hypothetical protein